VRLVVPGWYGMASVKWVTRIAALTRPFDGYFQRQRYVYDTVGAVVPVTRMRVKSIIIAPADAAHVAPGVVHAWGWAWSGAGAIARVDVSRNSDDTWHPATLDTAVGPHAWTRWECPLTLDHAGRYVIRARAADATGAVQPLVPEWNRLGYGNNAVQAAVVECA
jgi:DMSO/TMAO reductase YedYZ molybdopterin-dependent catalytic subunit